MITFVENFSTILSGFLTPVIAGAMVYIAYRQYKIDRDKLKWNLYEKRMEVFQSLRDLLIDVEIKADISYEELNKFLIKVEKGCFLFDSNINDYLSEVRNKCFLLREHRRKLGDSELGRGEKRNRLAKEEQETLLWLIKQYRKSKELFEEYLKIDR